jgi:predicted Zn-dependent protease
MTAVVLALALALAAPDAAKKPGFEQLSVEAGRAREDNRTSDAIRLYEQALKLNPSWKEGLWYLSTLYYGQDRFADARDILRRFTSHEPGTGPGWTLLGMSEFQTREYSRSLTHLQHGLALGIADRKEMTRSAYYFIGTLLTRFERFNESVDLMMQIARTEEPGDFLREAAGLAGLQMPLLPGEIPADRREMIRLAGSAVCALAHGRDADAEGSLKQLVAAHPGEPGVHFLFGAYLLKQRQEEGIAEMQRELEISPGHVMARVRLADEYLKADKLDLARSFAAKAVELDPGSSAARLTFGEVLLKSEDIAAAVRELEAARDLTPWVSRVRWVLSKAYFSAGRKADGEREAAEVEKLKKQENKKLF